MICIIKVHSPSLQTCWQTNISVKMILIKLVVTSDMNEMKLTVWTRSNVKLLDTGMKYSLVETDDFTENFESKHELCVYPFVI